MGIWYNGITIALQAFDRSSILLISTTLPSSLDGKTTDSDSVLIGSNPVSAALEVYGIILRHFVWTFFIHLCES